MAFPSQFIEASFTNKAGTNRIDISAIAVA